MKIRTDLYLHEKQDRPIREDFYTLAALWKFVRFILVVRWKMFTSKRDLGRYPYFTVSFPNVARRYWTAVYWARDNVWHRRDPRYTVVVHRVDQGYGGAEEGGWWFQTREVEKAVKVWRKRDIDALMDALEEEYPNTGRSYSVLGGDDYRVRYYDRFEYVPSYEDDYQPYE